MLESSESSPMVVFFFESYMFLSHSYHCILLDNFTWHGFCKSGLSVCCATTMVLTSKFSYMFFVVNYVATKLAMHPTHHATGSALQKQEPKQKSVTWHGTIHPDSTNAAAVVWPCQVQNYFQLISTLLVNCLGFDFYFEGQHKHSRWLRFPQLSDTAEPLRRCVSCRTDLGPFTGGRKNARNELVFWRWVHFSPIKSWTLSRFPTYLVHLSQKK